MSILLESLSQQSASENNKVPDIHVSHFDDEMMGDDWLLQRIKRWQLFCGLLVILLVASWIYFYYHFSDNLPGDTPVSVSVNQQVVGVEKPAAVDRDLQTSVSNANGGKAATVSNTPVNDAAEQTVTNNVSNIVNNESAQIQAADNEPVKQVYVPKKREPVVQEVSPREALPTKKIAQKPTQVAANDHYEGAILWRDELSDDIKNQMPNIEINSYVVSDKPEDSFVILDGGFYKINQVIAPDLILREITQKFIVVEFHSMRVKLPLN